MLYSSRSLVALAASLAGCFLEAVPAQGTIRDSNVAWTLRAIPAAGQFAPHDADFSANGCVTDVLFESRWLWRKATDPDAQPFLAGNNGGFTQTWGASSVDFDWTDAALDGSIDARHTVTVRSTSAVSGVCEHSLTVTNISGARLDLDLFFYVDFDHNVLFGNDRTLAGSTPDRILVGDDEACGGCVEMQGEGVAHFEVGAFPTVIQNLQASGTSYDLADTGLPFGPGDFTGAMQWSVSLPAGGQATLRASIAHDDLTAHAVASAQNSGAPTVGAAGTPTLTANGLPILGAPLALQIAGFDPGSPVASLWIGLGPVPSFDFCGVGLHVPAPLVTVPLTLVQGGATFAMPRLCDPSWDGVSLGVQALGIDVTSAACVPVVATDLLTLVYGD